MNPCIWPMRSLVYANMSTKWPSGPARGPVAQAMNESAVRIEEFL
jgi:hypothetical protein